MLDATRAGCCIVSTNIGGIPEVVKHNETGLSVTVGQPKELASALKQAIESPELRERLNRTAKELVAREFSPQKMVQGNFEVYRSLINLTGSYYEPEA
jgi:glycosyltransferase involved in cell wall biosynthesis